MLLPFRLSPDDLNPRLPLTLYNIGCHAQHPIARPSGYLVPQCFIVFSGKGIVRFKDDKGLRLEAGQALIVPAGQPHEYAALSGVPWIVGYIGFKGKLAEDLTAACGLPFSTVIRLKNVQKLSAPLKLLWELADYSTQQTLVQTAQHPLMQPTSSRASYISSRLYDFFLLLSDLAELTSTSDPQLGSDAADKALRRATGYMQDHYNESLQMYNIANVVGYSVQHFIQIFRKAYGITPHAYLQALRLNQAVRWMEMYPNMPVKEIAGRLGMEPNYFIRAFKKVYGLPPGAYRENLTVIPDS